MDLHLCSHLLKLPCHIEISKFWEEGKWHIQDPEKLDGGISITNMHHWARISCTDNHIHLWIWFGTLWTFNYRQTRPKSEKQIRSKSDYCREGQRMLLLNFLAPSQAANLVDWPITYKIQYYSLGILWFIRHIHALLEECLALNRSLLSNYGMYEQTNTGSFTRSYKKARIYITKWR